MEVGCHKSRLALGGLLQNKGGIMTFVFEFLGGILGSLLGIELFYCIFAGIFKHKVGFCITAVVILFGAGIYWFCFGDMLFAIYCIISLIVIYYCPTLQIRNKEKKSIRGKEEKPNYHYYWYKERVARIDVKNLSDDFEFYENNEWVKNDKLSYALFEAIRISVEKWGKDIYKITNKERAIELINKAKGNPETQDLDSEIQELDLEVQNSDSETQELDSEVQDLDSETQDLDSN